MNKTLIDWVRNPDGTQGYTHNYVVGCPEPRCDYCYGYNRVRHRLAHRCMLCGEYIPHTHPERLIQPSRRKKPAMIFADSLSDFGLWKPNWQEDMLKVMRDCPQHTFVVLSKHPAGYMDVDFPPNVWVGVSVERQEHTWRIDKLLELAEASVRFASFEPLLSPIDCDLEKIDWIIIGGLTPKSVHEISWIEKLRGQAKSHGIPVFIKDNARYKKSVREFPMR